MKLTPENPITYYWKCGNGHRYDKAPPLIVCKECGNKYRICKKCGSKIYLEAEIEVKSNE